MMPLNIGPIPTMTVFGAGGYSPVMDDDADTAVSAGSGVAGGPQLLSVMNASTTYGIDTSVANNYGLGPTFLNAANGGTVQAQQQAAPSLWWLLFFVCALAVIA